MGYLLEAKPMPAYHLKGSKGMATLLVPDVDRTQQTDARLALQISALRLLRRASLKDSYNGASSGDMRQRDTT